MYALMPDRGAGGGYYDFCDRAFAFDVEPGDFHETGELPPPVHGALLVRGGWLHQEASKGNGSGPARQNP